MAERPKAHDWKSCVPRKGTEGSNPSLCAIFVVRKSYNTQKAQDIAYLVLFCYHILWFAPFAEYLNLGAAF